MEPETVSIKLWMACLSRFETDMWVFMFLSHNPHPGSFSSTLERAVPSDKYSIVNLDENMHSIRLFWVVKGYGGAADCYCVVSVCFRVVYVRWFLRGTANVFLIMMKILELIGLCCGTFNFRLCFGLFGLQLLGDAAFGLTPYSGE